MSVSLIQAISDLRSVKDTEEIKEIEAAIEISKEMHIEAIRMCSPGIFENDIYGRLTGISYSKGRGPSFQMTCSVKGEILHNHSYVNSLSKGNILIVDSGAESFRHYASDITRTLPVGGKFSSIQKDIYNIVISALNAVIKKIAPGVKYIDCHLNAAYVIAEGLKNLGILKGNIADIVDTGAHSLFFPHGIGHLLGLDVHDMESYGEDYIGYDASVKRSSQFGLSSLRLGKKLKNSFVITVEPGIYFIPNLIKKWKSQNTLSEFINYNKVVRYLDFGGIRIEDDILVTEEGNRVLSEDIPKTIEDIEMAFDMIKRDKHYNIIL